MRTEVGELARLAFRTAGQVRMLAERMAALDFKADGYEQADLAPFADTIQGMALRAAMSMDDGDALLLELTGRRVRRLDTDGPTT
ncbi:hypothetical protein [Nocardia sp. NPDC059239]|uniref:hypothetical protein n=1 Tax=Nocardia sp. NPDC059239 TaxID=3346785 RepID=UPI0036B9E9AB